MSWYPTINIYILLNYSYVLLVNGNALLPSKKNPLLVQLCPKKKVFGAMYYHRTQSTTTVIVFNE